MQNQEKDNLVILLCCTVIIYFLTNIACSSIQNELAKPQETKLPVDSMAKQVSYPALSWENTTAPHPERAAWSKSLIDIIGEKFDVLDKAKDMSKYCPKFSLLTKKDKINALAEFMVALAYYESGYNPKASSVDVGTKDDKSTWSIGLWQMSVIDQSSYNIKFCYNYDDLLKPAPNAKLAIYVLAKQIASQGLICVDKNVYWATLSCKSTAKYQVNNQIAARLQKAFKSCL